MSSSTFRGLLRRAISVAAWAVIVLVSFGLGFGAIPEFYLLISGQAQPGDLLPDGRLMTTAEHAQEIVTDLIVIVICFGIKAIARRLLRP
ncbi:hypothetical protein KIH07_12035 [Hydrogenophaga taeniospiralis]|uniref:hypothetical protein n=1 Tax=Hydrogenophaga taeniospiralis TaxID=65656 RepID=UPI001CF97030|nr:hypothetical protein [Hydrogenophaga taeniospiralis]MCB4364466.1 hypothetical protein [Hydrogenophaga taeniospiralis]